MRTRRWVVRSPLPIRCQTKIGPPELPLCMLDSSFCSLETRSCLAEIGISGYSSAPVDSFRYIRPSKQCIGITGKNCRMLSIAAYVSHQHGHNANGSQYAPSGLLSTCTACFMLSWASNTALYTALLTSDAAMSAAPSALAPASLSVTAAAAYQGRR